MTDTSKDFEQTLRTGAVDIDRSAALLADMEPWKQQAACRTTPVEVFYPTTTSRRTSEVRAAEKPALEICHRCPVRDECLETALRHGIRFGIWGGATEKERQRIKRRRRRNG